VSVNSISTTITSAAPSNSSSLRRLSLGARMISPRDRIVTAGVETKLAREIQTLKQASRNAGEVTLILQAAAASAELIDGILTRMAELAGQAATFGLSNAERGILHEEFSELRTEVDVFADAATFANSPILNGTNSFAAASIGSDIQSDDGIQSLTFDSSAGGEFVASGDSIAVNFDSSSDVFTVTNLTTGRTANSLAVSSAPTGGQTSNINIAEFGLTIEINSSFSTAADITANNSLQVSGSASNQVDLALRIGTGVSAVDEISIELERVRVATMPTDFQHDDLLTVDSAADTVLSITAAQDFIGGFENKLLAGMQRINRAVEGLNNTISNYEAANARLIDIANSAVQELLHDVIAENVNSVLSSSDDVSELLSRLSESDKAVIALSSDVET